MTENSGKIEQQSGKFGAACARLAEMDRRAVRENLYGTVGVKIHYQKGEAKTVRCETDTTEQ